MLFVVSSYRRMQYAGTIEVAEMVEIVGNLYEVEGVSKVGVEERGCLNKQFVP